MIFVTVHRTSVQKTYPYLLDQVDRTNPSTSQYCFVKTTNRMFVNIKLFGPFIFYFFIFFWRFLKNTGLFACDFRILKKFMNHLMETDVILHHPNSRDYTCTTLVYTFMLNHFYRHFFFLWMKWIVNYPSPNLASNGTLRMICNCASSMSKYAPIPIFHSCTLLWFSAKACFASYSANVNDWFLALMWELRSFATWLQWRTQDIFLLWG